MSVKIAGLEVKVGDRLYSSEYRAWGVVTRFDSSGPAIAEFPAKPRGVRNVYIQNGGLVNGSRSIYWHPPIDVDVPDSDITELKRLVDHLIAFKYGKGNGNV